MAPALPDPAARHADPPLREVEIHVHAAVARDDDRPLARVEPEDLRPGALVKPPAVAPEAPDLPGAAADGAEGLGRHEGPALRVSGLALEEGELGSAEPLFFLRLGEFDLRRLEGEGLRFFRRCRRGGGGRRGGGLGLEDRPGR